MSNNNVDNLFVQSKQMGMEVQAFKSLISYLWDENQDAFNILYFVQQNYKEAPKMFVWLKRNKIIGKKLVDLFKNESPDGGGYHMGATYILSRIKGFKHQTTSIKIDELK